MDVNNVRHLLTEATDALFATGGDDDDILELLRVSHRIARRLTTFDVTRLAELQRRGTFTERGYKSPAAALSDMLGIERGDTRLRVVAAEQVCPRVALDGTALPPRLPATAAVFTAGQTTVRHIDVIAKVLGSAAASRLTPQQWAGVEAELAEKAAKYTPTELHTHGAALVELLDQDGAEPDERAEDEVNELHILPHRGRSGGSIRGRFDNAEMFDAIATLIDAKAKPLTGDDRRGVLRRQAEALADVCGYVLDHGDVPDCGGERPHVSVIFDYDTLRQRFLHFGGTITPESLRMMACDARVIPIVMNGQGQPLDVGRAQRTIPAGIRHAVNARDRGCAYPGCGATVSWTECHHILSWLDGGETKISNLVALCRVHHRLLHHTEWIVRIRDGLPEFVPPRWIDPDQVPRRKPGLCRNRASASGLAGEPDPDLAADGVHGLHHAHGFGEWEQR